MITNQKILHKLIKGMDDHRSCGVPKTIWKLVKKLTRECYGEMGVFILKDYHETYEDSIEWDTVNILHSLRDVEELTEKLEELGKENQTAWESMKLS
jgi:glutaredoxin-related protein